MFLLLLLLLILAKRRQWGLKKLIKKRGEKKPDLRKNLRSCPACSAHDSSISFGVLWSMIPCSDMDCNEISSSSMEITWVSRFTCHPATWMLHVGIVSGGVVIGFWCAWRVGVWIAGIDEGAWIIASQSRSVDIESLIVFGFLTFRHDGSKHQRVDRRRSSSSSSSKHKSKTRFPTQTNKGL